MTQIKQSPVTAVGAARARKHRKAFSAQLTMRAAQRIGQARTAYVRAGNKVLYPSDRTETWLEKNIVEPVRETK